MDFRHFQKLVNTNVYFITNLTKVNLLSAATLQHTKWLFFLSLLTICDFYSKILYWDASPYFFTADLNFIQHLFLRVIVITVNRNEKTKSTTQKNNKISVEFFLFIKRSEVFSRDIVRSSFSFLFFFIQSEEGRIHKFFSLERYFIFLH